MKLTREEVLRLMRQASGGILTRVAEDPRCGYEIKVEELQTFAELLQAANECGSVPDCAVWISEALIRDEWVNHVNTDPSIHHWPEVLAFAKRIAVISANKGYRTALQSGISSPSHRPNEQNAVQAEQPSLSDERVWDIYLKAQESIPFERSSSREFAIALTKAILVQRQ